MSPVETRTYVPIVDLLRGITKNEVACAVLPTRLDPRKADTLTQYISSFMIRTYRADWESRDLSASNLGPVGPPCEAKPETETGVAKNPGQSANHVSNESETVPNKAPYGCISARTVMKRWQIRIYARGSSNGPEEPIFGKSSE